MADDDGIITVDGHQIPPLELTASMLTEKTVVLYGPSQSGKTVIIKHCMKLLSSAIEQCLVIAPTEPANQSYKGIVDAPFIHYQLALPGSKCKKAGDNELEFLQAIWDRQEIMAGIYNRANDPEVLARLFARLPRDQREDGRRVIAAVSEKRKKVLAQISLRGGEESSRESTRKEIDDKYRRLLVLLYKRYIEPNYAQLRTLSNLSDDEKWCLDYLSFNPRILLNFDDCAAALKPVLGKEIFRKLYYQNRHSFITAIMAFQDDTDLNTNLRRNAFVSIFTTPQVANSYFERRTNQFSKEERKFAEAIIPEIFSKGHRKMAYIREDPTRQHFYYIEVPYPKPFRFGSEAFHELCKAVECDGLVIRTTNPYYERFRIPD